MSHCILIVHPDASTRSLIFSMLQAMGHRLEEADSTAGAIRFFESRHAELVLAGLGEDPSDVLALVEQLRRKTPPVRVLPLASSSRPDVARELAMRGALACIRFPLPAMQLRAAVSQALPEESGVMPRTNGAHSGQNGMVAAATRGHVANGSAYPVVVDRDASDSVCEDSTFLKVLDLAEALAVKRSPFLITGERGSGRRFLARTLHEKSPWRDGPMRVVSCDTDFGTTEDERLIELFGRATPDDPSGVEPGLLARAAGGTVFLDDLQEVSPTLQAQLLRVIRDGEYQPFDSTSVQRLECRLVLGSCEDLGSLVELGQIRSDLFYALSAVTLQIPPLRHRGGDILKLAEHFRERVARQCGKPVVGISAEAARRLTSHDWPGNIGELKSVMERAVSRCRGHWIEPNHLDLEARDSLQPQRRPTSVDQLRQSILPLKEALEEPEKRLILEALRALNWNRQETARVLDINRTTLYKKMKKYGLVFEEPVWSN